MFIFALELKYTYFLRINDASNFERAKGHFGAYLFDTVFYIQLNVRRKLGDIERNVSISLYPIR